MIQNKLTVSLVFLIAHNRRATLQHHFTWSTSGSCMHEVVFHFKQPGTCAIYAETHLVLLAALPLGSQLVLLLSEVEIVVSLFEGIRVWLVASLSVPCGGDKMAVSPLGVSLDQLLRYLQGVHGARHHPERKDSAKMIRHFQACT